MHKQLYVLQKIVSPLYVSQKIVSQLYVSRQLRDARDGGNCNQLGLYINWHRCQINCNQLGLCINGYIVKSIAISLERVSMDVDGGFDGGFDVGFNGRLDGGFNGRFDSGCAGLSTSAKRSTA